MRNREGRMGLDLVIKMSNWLISFEFGTMTVKQLCSATHIFYFFQVLVSSKGYQVKTTRIIYPLR